MKKGSITVYLSLVLTIILGLLCTLIESGRINTIKAKINGITYMGLDSSFADYASPLFEDYGLLFLWCTQEQFEEKFSDYISYNTELNKGLLFKDKDLYHIKLRNIEIKDLNHATDKHGEIFYNQVEQYMKYSLTENAIKEIIARTDVFHQSSSVKKFYDKITQYSEQFEKVENAVAQVKESVEKVRSIKENPYLTITDMLNNAYEIANGNEEINSVFANQFYELKNTSNNLIKYLEEIKTTTQSYSDAADSAKEVMLTLGNNLLSEKESLGQELYGVLEEELMGLEDKSTNNGSDYYGIFENSKVVEEYLAKMKRLDEFVKLNSGNINNSNVDTTIDGLSELAQSFADFDTNNLSISYEVSSVQKDENTILDYIHGLMENGILELVVEDPGSISTETINSNELPSFNYDQNGNGEDVIKKKVILSEYIRKHFGNYGNTLEETKLLYEQEYIIGGKNSDKENLAAVVNDLTLLRQGCNLVHLLKDNVKRNEAFQMATAIAGFTGLPMLITLTQFLILNAWAYAESILDVKNLLAGEKVVVFKTNQEWNLSLAGAKNLTKSTDSSKSISDKGLDYQQYLQILLLTQNVTSQNYRTMDLIQLNIGKRENDSFRLEECINMVEVQANYSAKPLFITLPFVKNMFGYKEGEYLFKSIQNYEY